MNSILKNPRSSFRTLAASLAALAATAAAPSAHADLCADLPSPVYTTGGGKVALQSLGTLLAGGVSIIYKVQGSCLALDAVVNGTPLEETAIYWTAEGKETPCDLDPKGVVADIGISDVFPATCGSLPGGLPKNMRDYYGPVEAYTFVVPVASKEMSISMAAAYMVFGFGANSGVEPWTDEKSLFIRDAQSGTQQMLGIAIGVPADRWKGVSAGDKGSSQVVANLKGAMNKERALGILTAEVAKANDDYLRVLAYQAEDQTCGYYPNSTDSTKDKRNVRDGHYWPWGPLHLLSQVNDKGIPLNEKARDVISYLAGTKDLPNKLDLIKLFADVGIIPQCAMRVRRESELGPLTSFAPQGSCGCYFEKVAGVENNCTQCTSAVDCPADEHYCNYGFCEVL